MPTPTANESGNLVAHGLQIGIRVYHDPYVVTATSEDTACMRQVGLLPSDFWWGLMQITSWPVPASEPYDKQFDNPDFSLYSSWRT